MLGIRRLGVAALFLLLASCVSREPDNHPIRPGVFYAEDGVEQIVVGEQGMYFVIEAVDGRIGEHPGRMGPYIAFYPSMFFDRAKEYTVDESGEIQVSIYISTDPFLEYRFTWHKDLDRIAKVVRRTGKTTWFRRAECERRDDSCAKGNDP